MRTVSVYRRGQFGKMSRPCVSFEVRFTIAICRWAYADFRWTKDEWRERHGAEDETDEAHNVM